MVGDWKYFNQWQCILLNKFGIRVLIFKRNEILEICIRHQLVYFYLQVVEHFNGSYSEKILYTNKPKELDAQFALEAFRVFYIYSYKNERAQKQINLLQESNSDSIFHPTYLMVLPSLFKAITSWGGGCKQSYILKEEVFKERMGDEDIFQKALTYMDRHSSHIQVLSYPKSLDGKLKIEMKMFLIPPVFKYLTQEKKDQLWLSFDKENAETLWISIWKNWHEIFREFYAREQVNQMTFLGFFSEQEAKVWRLIEHLILITNLLVLITQGYKDDHPQLGPTPYAPTLVILFFFGTCMLFTCWMMSVTSFMISFKSRNTEVQKEDTKPRKCTRCYKLSPTVIVFGKAIYKEMALLVWIVFAILAYADTTLYSGCLVFVIVRQKSMMNVIKAVWMAKYLLIATIGLILISIYFFAVFSVLVLKNDYDKTLSGSCKNAWFCSVTIFDSWYKADGTIGGWLNDEAPSLSSGNEYNTDGVRIASDFFFNFIVGILLLEIFSGILTDTFAKIRSEQEELNGIQETRCFVCDKESKEFADFKHHTQYDHNLWDYIIYMFILSHSKDNKYQNFLKKDCWKILKMDRTLYLGRTFRSEGDVNGIEYLKAIINKELLLNNSDDYVRACLAHYERTRDSKTTPFEIKRYLSWLPYNLTSMKESEIEKSIKNKLEENAKSTREGIKKELNDLERKVEGNINEMDKKMDQIDDKMNEMDKKIRKILSILENK
jgi:hypothetical protein